MSKPSPKRLYSIFHTRIGRWQIFFAFLCMIMLAVGSIIAGNLFNASAFSSGGKTSSSSQTSWGQQAKVSKDNLWVAVEENTIIAANGTQTLGASTYRTMHLNSAALTSILSSAPKEFTPEARNTQVEMTIPMPDGAFARFRITESPISQPDPSGATPDFRSYSGQGIDDPTATARFDWSSTGFHAQVISASRTVYVDPYAKGDISNYITYDKKYFRKEEAMLESLVSKSALAGQQPPEQAIRTPLTTNAGPNGAKLRSLRTAIAATGEYTNFFRQAGDSNLQAKLRAYNQILVTMNRVNGIWERDMAIRFVLLSESSELSIIYPDAATDPYANGANANTNSDNNQTNLDATIGNANYDIGHVFSVGGGGVGAGGVCVVGDKARGATATNSPQGDPFDVDFVAHEIIHQFNGEHTFNEGNSGECNAQNRGPTGAYEPGSGSTVASYAGICGPADLQTSSDDYFHSSSIDQVLTWVNANSCATQVVTGNAPPTVNAGPNFNIPRNTPFTLTATASDPDGDAVTYAWEEFDLGDASPPNTDNGNRPLFRPYRPTTSPSRTFPSLQYILNNANNPVQTIVVGQGTPAQHNGFSGENMPTTTRSMKFRVTVRDNKAGGGALNTSEMTVNVNAGAGPFAVTAPNTAVSFAGNSQQTVTWSVAGTNNAPVLAANVKISLSTDGGNTFPTVLLASTPNDGSETITIPNTPTATARIKVEAVGNIFFDISDTNFTITAGPAATTTVGLSSATYTVSEADPTGIALITVNRTGDTSGVTTVDYVTSDNSALIPCQTNGNGIASDRCDYATAVGTVRFAAGDSSKTIQIPIINDSYVEPNEVFTITLRNPQGAALGILTATVTIQNDDAQTATTNPINDTSFFIKQQYVDFLGRVAEPGGFNFWLGRMTNPALCQGQTDPCDRVDTAKRFFESDEFRERGFYVYKLYDATLGRFPLYSEFVPEVARLNGPQTVQEQRLGKDAYLLDFMNKTEFKNLYDQYLTADHSRAKDAANAQAFVDALCTKAGVVPASKATLVANLVANVQNPATGRDPAHTLEDFILTPEIDGLGTRFYDRARIVMQYFGFLRRDPDTGGFNFWWARVATAGSPQFHDYRELVNNFIRSDEYNFRFAFLPAP